MQQLGLSPRQRQALGHVDRRRAPHVLAERDQHVLPLFDVARRPSLERQQLFADACDRRIVSDRVQGDDAARQIVA